MAERIEHSHCDGRAWVRAGRRQRPGPCSRPGHADRTGSAGTNLVCPDIPDRRGGAGCGESELQNHGSDPGQLTGRYPDPERTPAAPPFRWGCRHWGMRVARMPGYSVAIGIPPLAIATELNHVLRCLYQLSRVIENADVFYLFWSRFANASEQVEREWRTASVVFTSTTSTSPSSKPRPRAIPRPTVRLENEDQGNNEPRNQEPVDKSRASDINYIVS